jgi:hypothetical protein
VVLAAAVAVVALLAGCTDDDDDASPRGEGDNTTTAPADGEPLRANFGDTLELNVTYRYPMDMHCGLDNLGEFNDTAWILVAAPGGNPEEGAGEEPPAHWPLGPEGVEGRIVLVGEDRIE